MVRVAVAQDSLARIGRNPYPMAFLESWRGLSTRQLVVEGIAWVGWHVVHGLAHHLDNLSHDIAPVAARDAPPLHGSSF